MSKSPSGREATEGFAAGDKDVSVECPTCGEEFDTLTGTKIHHFRMHGEALPGEDNWECEICGKKYTSQIGLKRHYESVCRGGGYSCPKCDNIHTTERGLNYHISEVHNSPVRVEVECGWCGSVRSVQPWRANTPGDYYCSNRCNGKATMGTGEEKPRWKPNTTTEFGYNWIEIRQKVRDRDGHTCQACGADEEDLYRSLDVHHIIPRNKFEDIEKANEMKNLISLCMPCHKKWEGIPVRPQLS